MPFLLCNVAAANETPVVPDFIKAGTLQQECSTLRPDATEANFCAIYIMGVIDGIVGVYAENSRHAYCVKGSSYWQQIMVVKKWLDNNPERWHWTRYMAVNAALREAFPCAEQQG